MPSCGRPSPHPAIPGFAGFFSEPDLDTVLAAAAPGCPLIYLFATPRGGYAVAVYRDAAGQPGRYSPPICG